MKKVLSIILSLVFIMTISCLPTSINAKQSRVEIHDPSITLSEDGKYYIVGSHLAMGESDDLINWHSLGYSIDGTNYLSIDGKSWTENLAEPLAWTSAWQNWCIGENKKAADAGKPLPYKDYANDYEYNCWANDIIYNKHMGCYCLYGSCSVWGTTASVIWLATSKNIEGPYQYQSSFIYSGITDITESMPGYNGLHYKDTNIKADLLDKGLITEDEISDMPWFTGRGFYDCGWGKYPNCIDPTAFTDANGDMWLVYGSYSGGCFVIKLKNATGTPDYEYMKATDGYDIYYGKQITKTNGDSLGTGEGPYIIYDKKSGYFYFYLTYGGLDARGGYNIREYRSKNPDGPYYDAAGYDARQEINTGLKLVGNYKFSSNELAYLAPGHSSCLIDSDDSMYQVYHVRFDGMPSNNTSGHEVRVHKMMRTADGWSVMLPFEYKGEKDIASVSNVDVVGAYEFINSTNRSQSIDDYGKPNNNDIILKTQLIYLNADGTINGVKDYKFDDHYTDLGSTEVSGTWKLVDNTTYADFKIGNVSYSVVFAIQKDESQAQAETLVFAGKGTNNSTIWGVKDENHTHNNIVTKVVTKPTCTASGTNRRCCIDCGAILGTDTLNALGHKAVVDKSVASTYASTGLTQGSHCSVCKKVLVAQTRIAKKTVPKTSVTKITPKSKSFTLSWKKVAVASGYHIQYSTSSKFSSPKNIYVSAKSTSKAIKKLKGAKKYYVRIRAHKTYNGKKYYSSYVKTSVKTKK